MSQRSRNYCWPRSDVHAKGTDYNLPSAPEREVVKFSRRSRRGYCGLFKYLYVSEILFRMGEKR